MPFRRAVTAVCGTILLATPLLVHAAVPEPYIYEAGPIGTPEVPGMSPRAFQTAFRPGDTLKFRAWVHSKNNSPRPSLVADFSSLGHLSAATTPANSAGTSGPYPPAFWYDFAWFVIGAGVPDGVKEISLLATDSLGNTDTKTVRIAVDTVPPTITLDALSFPDAPTNYLNFTLSGRADGTGTAIRAGKLSIQLLEPSGRWVDPGFTSTRYNPDIPALNTAFANLPGTFTDVPLLYFGLAGITSSTTIVDLSSYTAFKAILRVYDEAGNIATSEITVPIPPVDPCGDNGCASSVLFLPGLEASRLYRAGDDRVWEPLGDTDAQNLTMNPDGTAVRDDIYTRDVIDNAYAPGKGNIYKSFLEQLEEMKTGGLINDYTATPYDWRLTLDGILDTGRRTSDGKIYYSGPQGATTSPYIIQELRRLAAASQTGKVTLIAHSNGGLLAKALVGRLGAEAPQLIDKIIFVAVPQAGTPQAVGALLHGFDQSLPVSWFPFALSAGAARTLAQNMPSVYNLLPSENYFTYVDYPVITISDDPLLAPWRAAYGDVIHSGERLHTFLTDQSRVTLPTTDPLVSPPIGNEALLNASEEVHSNQDSWTPPGGIELVEIAGWGMETLRTIAYYEGVESVCTARAANSTCAALIRTPVLQYKPEMVLDGDGTVVVPSALWTPSSTGVQKYWVDLDDYASTNIGTRFANRKHADILEVPNLRLFIQNLVTNTATSLPKFIYTSTPPNDESDVLHFTLHSPLTLNLYDDQGNHTGFSTTTSSLEDNIPGSTYLSFGEVQYISVPASANARLIMEGTEDGSFTLDIEETEGSTVTAETAFAGIPSFTDTVVTMNIPADAGIAGAGDLEIDVQGDGVVDIELEPKLNETTIFHIPYVWRGFLQPINDIAYQTGQTPSIFKAGSTVPVKFQLRNADGAVVQAETLPEWLPPEPGASMNATIDESTYSVSATSGSTYRWDPESQQYIYNWNTKGLTSGRWYTIYTKLDDSNTHSVTIGLR